MSSREFKTDTEVKTSSKYSSKREFRTDSNYSLSNEERQSVYDNIDELSYSDLKALQKNLGVKTKATTKDALKKAIKADLKPKSDLTKEYLAKEDYKSGEIDSKEFRQVGLTDRKGLMKDKAPVEAIEGIDSKSGYVLRKDGFKKVGQLREEQAKNIQKENLRLYDERRAKIKSDFQKKQEEKFIVGELEISRSDLDYQTASNAYRNTSFDSDKRAIFEQEAYLGAMQSMYDNLEPYVKNDEQKRVLNEEMKRYQKNFIKRRQEILYRRSGLASSAITGGSNFPVRQQKKRQEIDDRKMKEFHQWNDKVEVSVKRKINKEITEEEKFSSLEKDIIKDTEIAATTEFRGEKVPSYVRTGAKARIAGRVETLANNGQTAEVEKVLKLIEDTQEKKGKTVFIKRNRIWKEAERSERINQIQSEKIDQKENIIMTFTGGSIVNNYDDERVQIFFDEKPSADVRKDLKSEGWRWSPTKGVWQRKNTWNAENSSKRIIGKHFEEKKVEVEPVVSQSDISVDIKRFDKVFETNMSAGLDIKDNISDRVKILADEGKTVEVEKILTEIKDSQDQIDSKVFADSDLIWKEADRSAEIQEFNERKLSEPIEPTEPSVSDSGLIVNPQLKSPPEGVAIPLFVEKPEEEILFPLDKPKVESPKDSELKYAVFDRYNNYMGKMPKETAERLANEGNGYYYITYRSNEELKSKREAINIKSDTYFKDKPAIRKEIKLEIDRLPEKKKEQEERIEQYKIVKEKVESKKSWGKKELEDYVSSQNVYIDLSNTTGRKNWIAEAESDIDRSISNSEREIKHIDQFQFYVKENNVSAMFVYHNDHQAMQDEKLVKRIDSMNDQIELWEKTKADIDSAKTIEELNQASENYISDREVLEKKTDKLKDEYGRRQYKYAEDTRELPERIGTIIYAEGDSLSLERQKQITTIWNSDEWKAMSNQSQFNFKEYVVDKRNNIIESQQKIKVEEVKKTIKKVKVTGDVKDVIAFTADKKSEKTNKSISESWIVLPNGRVIKIRKGKVVDKSSKNYQDEIKSLDITAVYHKKDLTDKERYQLAFALAEAYGVESFEEYKSKPDMSGIIMDSGHHYGLVDRDQSKSLDLSGYQEYKLSDLEVVQDSKGSKQYKINDTLYSGNNVDRMLKFATKNKKDYNKLKLTQKEGYPLYIAIPVTDQPKDSGYRLGLLLAPMSPEEDYDPYADDEDEYDPYADEDEFESD